jgi:hypothetical protein
MIILLFISIYKNSCIYFNYIKIGYIKKIKDLNVINFEKFNEIKVRIDINKFSKRKLLMISKKFFIS